jgi:hypothetical protein
MVTTWLPVPGKHPSEGLRARPVALELNKHHAEQV